jgi:hypothetical protein
MSETGGSRRSLTPLVRVSSKALNLNWSQGRGELNRAYVTFRPHYMREALKAIGPEEDIFSVHGVFRAAEPGAGPR